jgi:hypothetical protein
MERSRDTCFCACANLKQVSPAEVRSFASQLFGRVAPMAVIQFYESRVSFDKPKSKKESNGTSEKKMEIRRK